MFVFCSKQVPIISVSTCMNFSRGVTHVAVDGSIVFFYNTCMMFKPANILCLFHTSTPISVSTCMRLSGGVTCVVVDGSIV